MHRRPFEGRHLVLLIADVILLIADVILLCADVFLLIADVILLIADVISLIADVISLFVPQTVFAPPPTLVAPPSPPHPLLLAAPPQTIRGRLPIASHTPPLCSPPPPSSLPISLKVLQAGGFCH